MTAHTQLWVYNSENRFVGLFYQFTCRVKRTKGLNDKPEFWDRLMVMVMCLAFKYQGQSSARKGMMVVILKMCSLNLNLNVKTSMCPFAFW